MVKKNDSRKYDLELEKAVVKLERKWDKEKRTIHTAQPVMARPSKVQLRPFIPKRNWIARLVEHIALWIEWKSL